MGDAAGPSEKNGAATRVVLRTVLLLLLIELPGSSLDVATTEMARRDGGFVELNPSGFLPLHQAVLMELRRTLLDVVLVGLGAYFRREALRAAVSTRREQFFESLFARNIWAVPLLWLPLFGAVCRYPVVVSNACYLTLGWSPIDEVLLLPLARLFHNDAAAYVASILVGILVMWYPANAFIVRALYAAHGGGKCTPNQALQQSAGA